MVGSSVEVWQEIQPEDLRSASSRNWPRTEADSWGAREGGFELARSGRKKDNAETQRTQRVRREEDANWRWLFILGTSQIVNSIEPIMEKRVRLMCIDYKL